MKNNKKTIYIVDDDESILRSLKVYFELKGFLVVIYTSALEFLDCYDKNRYGCLVSDINMEGMNGIQLLESLNERNFLMPTVFITGHADVNIALDAMKKKAQDFIEKPFNPYDLLFIINEAIKEHEERYFANIRYLSLTNKELMVFNEVINGGKNKGIADSLFMSLGTVEAYRSKVMKKMEAKSIVDLVNMSNLIFK